MITLTICENVHMSCFKSYYTDLATSLKWIVKDMTRNLPIIRFPEEYSTNAISEQEDEANKHRYYQPEALF